MKLNNLSNYGIQTNNFQKTNTLRQNYSYANKALGADSVSFSGKNTQRRIAGLLAALGIFGALNANAKAAALPQAEEPYKIVEFVGNQTKFVVSPDILSEFFEGVNLEDLKVSYWNNPEKGQNATYSYTDSSGKQSRINYSIKDDTLKVTSRVFPNEDGNYTRITLDNRGEEYKEIFYLDNEGKEVRIAKYSTDPFNCPSVVNDAVSSFDKADEYRIHDQSGNFSYGASSERGILWVNDKPAYYAVGQADKTVTLNYGENNIFQFFKADKDATVSVGDLEFTFDEIFGTKKDGIYEIGSSKEDDVTLPFEDLSGMSYQVVKKGDLYYISNKSNANANLKVTPSKSTSVIDDENFNFEDTLRIASDKQAIKNAVESGIYTKEQLTVISDIISKNIFSLGRTEFIDEKYDEMNEILFGKPKDPELRKQLDAIGKEFNMQIKIENDTVLYDGEGKKPEHYITGEYLNGIYDVFAQMKKMGQRLPDEVYLTRFFASSNTFGEFCPENPDAIYLNVTGDIGRISEDIYKAYKQVFVHESAHMADCQNVPEGERRGKYDFLSNHTDVNIWEPETLARYNIDREKIMQYMGSYAGSNNQEFVAEVSSMITDEIIVQKPDGSYTINPDKVDKDANQYANPRGNTDWSETEEQLTDLNAIMSVYNEMTRGLIVKPLIIE